MKAKLRYVPVWLVLCAVLVGGVLDMAPKNRVGGALALGQEYPPSDESAAIAQVVALSVQKVKKDYPPAVRPVRRDVHTKAHGLVKAEFVIEANLPPELRQGLFKEPGVFPAWIRFSSASGQIQSDDKRDVHGMAIKLMGVPGKKLLEDEQDATTCDFLLVSTKAFMVKTAADYSVFMKAVNRGHPMSFFFGWNPFKWRLRELRNLIPPLLKKVRDPLQTQYWSVTPFRFGAQAAKFSARPQRSGAVPTATPTGPDFLKEVLSQRLQSEEVWFDFMVQLQVDPMKMPVEDATIVWDEHLSPFRKVASIRIPLQDLDSQARWELAENLSFTPWHALPEHQPLGAMNRIRREVYKAISTLRHELNGFVRKEPTPIDSD